jgi:hypothetical protein
MPTSRKFKEISPQATKGLAPDMGGFLDSDLLVLDNMRIYRGQWRKRPGQKQLITTLPGTAAAATAHAIVEYDGSLVTKVPTVTETEDPTGDGALEEHTLSSGTDAYALVDDFAANSASDYIGWAPADATTSPTNGDSRITLFTFADLATAFTEITDLTVKGYWQNTAKTITSPNMAINIYFAPCIRLGGVNYVPKGDGVRHGDTDFAAQVTASSYIGNSWATVNAAWSSPTNGQLFSMPLSTGGLDPTGKPWTVANINAAEFGWAFVNSSWSWAVDYYQKLIFPQPRITSFQIQVTGRTSVEERTNYKIFVSDTDWLLADEDVDTFSDIDTAAAAPITAHPEANWSSVFYDNRYWFTNGIDEIAYFPATPGVSNIMADLPGDPICACLGNYASRLFAGDVVESTVRTANRVLWSAINDGTDFTSASAGSIDLDETPGAVNAFVNFTEARDQTFIGVLVAFKTDAIFHLEATGIDSDPFDKRVMNNKVGLQAPRSVVSYTRPDGTAVLAFLGNDNGAINVYEWDGDTAVPIGDPISDTMLRESGFNGLKRAWGYVDPQTFHYVLGVPLGDGSPTKAWVYDITRSTWHTESFEPIDCVGTWRIGGVPTVILGKDDSLPYISKLGRLSDYNVGDGEDIPIRARWYTGWQRLAEEVNQRATVYRIWLYYRNLVPSSTVFVAVKSRTVGSDATKRAQQQFTTAATGEGNIHVAQLDLMIEGTLHQTVVSCYKVDEDIAIEKIVIEYEENDTFV